MIERNTAELQTEKEIDLLQMVDIIRSRWRLIAVLVVLAIAAGMAVNHFSDPVYETSTELLVEQQSSGTDILGLGLARQDKIENRLELINSPLVIERAAVLLATNGAPEAADGLHRRMNTSIVRNTDVIRITVTGDTPEIVKAGANALATAYQNYSNDRAKEQSVRILYFLEEQVERAEQRVEEAEMAVRDYQQGMEFVFLESEEQKLNSHIIHLENQRMATEIAIEEKRMLLDYIQDELRSLAVLLPQGFAANKDLVIKEIQSQIAALEATKVDYLARGLAEDSPEVRGIERRIRNTEEIMRGYITAWDGTSASQYLARFNQLSLDRISITAEIEGYSNRLAILEKRIDSLNDELWLLSDKAFELAKLQRAVAVNNSTYSMLVEELERARISVEREIGDVQIIRRGTAPTNPISPRRELNLAIAVVLSLFVGVGGAFVLEFMDNKVRSRASVEQLGIPLLGVIPLFKFAIQPGDELFPADSSEKSPLIASYVRIETNIRFANLDQPPKKVLFTSSHSNEGKTTTTVHMAYALAQSDQKVLVIDCDLRKPVTHVALRAERTPGLSEILSEQVELSDGLQRFSQDEVEFDFISAGHRPASVVSLLRSNRYKELLDWAESQYDWVLIDSPPIAAVSDALEVANLVDGVVLVIHSGTATIPAVQDSVRQLSQAGAEIFGAVLNQHISTREESYYGYYYYSYYEEQE